MDVRGATHTTRISAETGLGHSRTLINRPKHIPYGGLGYLPPTTPAEARLHHLKPLLSPLLALPSRALRLPPPP
jgi:hypothetical protein